jgi:hypothetical protein
VPLNVILSTSANCNEFRSLIHDDALNSGSDAIWQQYLQIEFPIAKCRRSLSFLVSSEDLHNKCDTSSSCVL